MAVLNAADCDGRQHGRDALNEEPRACCAARRAVSGVSGPWRPRGGQHADSGRAQRGRPWPVVDPLGTEIRAAHDRLALAELLGELGLERSKDRVGIGRVAFGGHLNRITPAGGRLRSGSRPDRHTRANTVPWGRRRRLIPDRRRCCGTRPSLACRVAGRDRG